LGAQRPGKRRIRDPGSSETSAAVKWNPE